MSWGKRYIQDPYKSNNNIPREQNITDMNGNKATCVWTGPGRYTKYTTNKYGYAERERWDNGRKIK